MDARFVQLHTAKVRSSIGFPVEPRLSLFPHYCLLCEVRFEGVRDLCEHCHVALPWNDSACPRCGQPLTSAGCISCRRLPVSCLQTVAPLRYEEAIATWVQALKFHSGFREGQVLGELLATAVEGTLGNRGRPDCIVPMPLATRRLLRRGHNQAAFIARIISKRVHIPVRHRLLTRTRATLKQADLPRSARRANVVRAFAASDVTGLHIALVDDVLTTGATMQSATRVLLANGAAAVEWWVAARTP